MLTGYEQQRIFRKLTNQPCFHYALIKRHFAIVYHLYEL